MATNDELRDLVEQLQRRRIDRRQFMRRAAALGLSVPALSALLAGQVGAQGATPGAGATLTSPTREQVRQQLAEYKPYADVFEAPGNKGGQIIQGDSTDLDTMNWILVSSYPTGFVVGLIYEGLIGGSVINGQPAPGLADSWEIAPDGVTYTFHLTKKAKWHDGVPFTADDVKFSFDAILNPKTNSPRLSDMQRNVASYRVIDPYTFEIKSNGKLATFLLDIPALIMPKHVWENVPPEKWANDPGSTGQDPKRVIGTGPFKFKEWIQGDHVTLVRNDAYWDTVTGNVPNIDEYVFKVLPDDNAAIEALKVGEIDILETIQAPRTKEIQATPGLDVTFYDTFGFTYYEYNLDPAKTGLFQDKKVRQALFIALDRKAITQNIFSGYGEVAVGTQGKLSIAYAPDKITTHYDYDPAKAKQLLADAGWKDTNGDGVLEKDGKDFKFDMTTFNSGGTTEQLTAYMQDAWKQVGVAMTPKYLPAPSVFQAGDDHNFQTLLQGFSWTPSASQGAMFRSDSYKGGFNQMKYSNPEYDKLDDEQLHELDQKKRIDLLIQQSNIVWDDLPVGIIRFGIGRTGYTKKVHHFHPNDYGFLWSLPWVWVEK